jgi:hypothetical protein
LITKDVYRAKLQRRFRELLKSSLQGGSQTRVGGMAVGDKRVVRQAASALSQSGGAELFHEPIGDVCAPVETLLAVADAVDHRAVRRIDGIFIET